MNNRTLLQNGSSHMVIIAALVFVLAGVLGIIFWNNSTQLKSDPAENTPTLTIKGKITEKRTSCGREILNDKDEPKKVAGICDSGNSIVVNDISVSTGGGSLGANPPKYITDINSLRAGDLVEIKYIQDKDGYSSTDCKSCYVKKDGASQNEPQNKQR